MTLIAGIYRTGEGPIPDGDIASLASSLGRSGHRVDSYRDKRLFLAKIDIGAFGSEGLCFGETVAAVTGEPVLHREDGRAQPRHVDLAELVGSDPLQEIEWLLRCRGTFSVAHYDPRSERLMLATDRAGVRAVYYCECPDHFYFASNMRILESIGSVPRDADLLGNTEYAILGYPLSNRTHIASIRTLRGGQFVVATNHDTRIANYWHWRDSGRWPSDRAELLDRMHMEFLSALSHRACRSDDTQAFLSGGLDSRVVVSGLTQLGKKVHTLTFAREGLVDSAIAPLYANAIGAHFTSHRVDAGEMQRTLKSGAGGSISPEDGSAISFPRLFFSGDGGSVGVGLVYMNESLVSALRESRLDEAVSMHLGTKRRFPYELFNGQLGVALTNGLRESVKQEIERSGTADAAKDFHVYLMDNDQRRHLHYHYEDIDRWGTEFLLPFFDSRFLEIIAQAPVDWFLYHDAYNDWLRCFPRPTYEVPWQAYPGHRSCEVSIPLPKVHSQWRKRSRSERFKDSNASFHVVMRKLLAGSLPATIFSSRKIAAVAVAHGLRLRDYSSAWIACARMLEGLDRAQSPSLPHVQNHDS